MPMYNASSHIEKCISSISRQLTEDYEVILVDDGSTDDTIEKVKRYGYRIVILKDGGNPFKSRNYGAKFASGDIFVFVDSDVVLAPDSIARIISKVSDKRVDAISGIYTKNTPATGFFSQLQNLIILYRLSKAPEFVTFTISAFFAVKRDAFEVVHGYNEKMSYFEDVELGHKL